MGNTVNNTTDIHFNYNTNTGHFDDFKININYKPKGSQ